MSSRSEMAYRGAVWDAARSIAAEMRSRLATEENLEVREQFSQELENLLEMAANPEMQEYEFADYLQSLAVRYNHLSSWEDFFESLHSKD